LRSTAHPLAGEGRSERWSRRRTEGGNLESELAADGGQLGPDSLRDIQWLTQWLNVD
jgi:hypothetical protein